MNKEQLRVGDYFYINGKKFIVAEDGKAIDSNFVITEVVSNLNHYLRA